MRRVDCSTIVNRTGVAITGDECKQCDVSTHSTQIDELTWKRPLVPPNYEVCKLFLGIRIASDFLFAPSKCRRAGGLDWTHGTCPTRLVYRCSCNGHTRKWDWWTTTLMPENTVPTWSSLIAVGHPCFQSFSLGMRGALAVTLNNHNVGFSKTDAMCDRQQ
ncbi:hypothetical protein F2P81_013598 [Scophthalmus maximus]|uniref:Uncharacterized protein n=1 Tax=Scophthalmus maximus TaxID=52904 RepID=A0A6A4STU1_SCOMX|nr:hypothetical protein F2P81_013598 [Scophthalmus maximus]